MWKFKDFLLFFFCFCLWSGFFFRFSNHKVYIPYNSLLAKKRERTCTSLFFLFKACIMGWNSLASFPTLHPNSIQYIFLPWIFFWNRKLFDLNNELHSYTCERQVSKWALLFRIYLAFTIVSCKVDQSSMHEFIAIRKETLWIVKAN
jgi:hypothetical protein